ncbi:MAG: hypothetical protein ABIG95_00435 [Candidatus Woesearchaeota archaeon]
MGKLLQELFAEIGIAVAPLKKRRGYVVLVLFLFLLFSLFGRTHKMLFFVPVLMIFASFSMFYNWFFRLSLGVELITLATVLCAVVYGPVTGAMVGFFSLLFAEIISTKLAYNTIISLAAVVVVGVVASAHLIENISVWGIAMTLLYDTMIIPLYVVTGSSPVKSFIYLVTHILWNGWVFTFVAPRLLEAMV